MRDRGLRYQYGITLGLLWEEKLIRYITLLLGWAGVLERVGLLGMNLSRCSCVLRLPVHPIELDLVPLLGSPLHPSGDPLIPLTISGLEATLDLGPEV